MGIARIAFLLTATMTAAEWNASTANPQARYIAVQLRDPFSIPGASHATVQLLDAARLPITSWTFEAGWRNRLGPPKLEYSSVFDADLLTLSSSPTHLGRDIAKLYFTIRNQKLRFIRLEDASGALARNPFGIDRYDLGVPPPATTTAEFAALLNSPDKADVLAVLLYLGGEPNSAELAKFTSAVGVIAAVPAIRQRVKQLASSPHPWIREAARKITE